MAAFRKRRASSDDDDYWCRKIRPENKGTFQTTHEDQFENRVILKAHRKLTGTNNKPEDAGHGGQTNKVFGVFSGFEKTSSTATIASTLSSISLNDSIKKTQETKSAENKYFFFTKFAPSSFTPEVNADATRNNSAIPSGNQDISEDIDSSNNTMYNFEKSNGYYSEIKRLNQAVSTWIQTHVDKNPLLPLTPIFRDYEKYLAEIDKTEGDIRRSWGVAGNY